MNSIAATMKNEKSQTPPAGFGTESLENTILQLQINFVESEFAARLQLFLLACSAAARAARTVR
jgi:hypothetical protein